MQTVVDPWVEQYERLKEILSVIDVDIKERSPGTTRNMLVARRDSLSEDVYNEAMALFQNVYKGEL